MSDTDTNAATQPKLFPLTGTVSDVRRKVTNGASPKPYAIFRFAYSVKDRKGEQRTDVRTAKAFGKALTNIEGALATDGPVTLLGRFDTTELGQTIVIVGVPRAKDEQQTA